jgi:hypothetical protein
VPIRLARRDPFADETMILHVVQNVADEFSLLAHRLDRAAEQPALIEVHL